MTESGRGLNCHDVALPFVRRAEIHSHDIDPSEMANIHAGRCRDIDCRKTAHANGWLRSKAWLKNKPMGRRAANQRGFRRRRSSRLQRFSAAGYLNILARGPAVERIGQVNCRGRLASWYAFRFTSRAPYHLRLKGTSDRVSYGARRQVAHPNRPVVAITGAGGSVRRAGIGQQSAVRTIGVRRAWCFKNMAYAMYARDQAERLGWPRGASISSPGLCTTCGILWRERRARDIAKDPFSRRDWKKRWRTAGPYLST